MGATEIILIVIGAVVFLLGYLLPARKKDLDEEVRLISEDEVRKLVSGEADHVRDKIGDIVDETVSYSIEKAERAMERIANEKIMAVSEYSDTVLEEIDKNHKEVVFLYDMLNDKHDNLMSTVNEAADVADGVKQSVKDTEVTAREAVERIDTVMKEADEALQRIKTAEESALQARKEARDVMRSVMKAAENMERDLAAYHVAKPGQKDTVGAAAMPANKRAGAGNMPGSFPQEKALAAPEPNAAVTVNNTGDSNVKSQDGKQEEAKGDRTKESPDMAGETVDFKPIEPKKVEIIHEPDGDYAAANEGGRSTSEEFASMGIFAPKAEEPEEPRRKARIRRTSKRGHAQENSPAVDIQFAQGKDNGCNNNERILKLHKAGKSNMAIAKELGLGLGEVKLVIDLFEGM